MYDVHTDGTLKVDGRALSTKNAVERYTARLNVTPPAHIALLSLSKT